MRIDGIPIKSSKSFLLGKIVKISRESTHFIKNKNIIFTAINDEKPTFNQTNNL